MKNHIGLFTCFIYPKSKLLDSTLKTIIQNYNIVSVKADPYEITIIFKNNENIIEVKGWNANKWFSWLGRGYILINNREVYRWDNERPSRKIMNLLLQKLLEYTTNNIIK